MGASCSRRFAPSPSSPPIDDGRHVRVARHERRSQAMVPVGEDEPWRPVHPYDWRHGPPAKPGTRHRLRTSYIGAEAGPDRPFGPSTGPEAGPDRLFGPPTGPEAGPDRPFGPSTAPEAGPDRLFGPSTGREAGRDRLLSPSTGREAGPDRLFWPKSGVWPPRRRLECQAACRVPSRTVSFRQALVILRFGRPMDRLAAPLT